MKHKLRNLLAFLVVASVLSGCIKKLHYLKKGDTVKKEFYISFPFEMRMGLIVLKAKVNGSDEEFEFIFDTGAFMSMVSADAAEKLKLRTGGKTKVYDSQNNNRSTPYATIDKLQIGNMEFENKGALVYPIPENSYFKCIAKDGIIGANIIKDCNWDIDFAARMITVSNNPFESDTIKPVKFKNTISGKPYVTMDILGKKEKNILIDMGSNGGFDIHKRAARKHRSFSSIEFYKKFDGTSQGIWGYSYDTAYLTLIDSVYMGKKDEAVIHNFPLRIKENTSKKLGLDVLAGYRIYLNYSKSNMYLTPYSIDTFDTELKGFGLIFNLKNDSVFVGSITEGSPAADSAIKVGDKVIGVNGEIPQDNFADVCGFLTWMRGVLASENELKVNIEGRGWVTLKRGAYRKLVYPHLGN